MIPENRTPTHPGVILAQEFLAQALNTTPDARPRHHLPTDRNVIAAKLTGCRFGSR